MNYLLLMREEIAAWSDETLAQVQMARKCIIQLGLELCKKTFLALKPYSQTHPLRNKAQNPKSFWKSLKPFLTP